MASSYFESLPCCPDDPQSSNCAWHTAQMSIHFPGPGSNLFPKGKGCKNHRSEISTPLIRQGAGWWFGPPGQLLPEKLTPWEGQLRLNSAKSGVKGGGGVGAMITLQGFTPLPMAVANGACVLARSCGAFWMTTASSWRRARQLCRSRRPLSRRP